MGPGRYSLRALYIAALACIAILAGGLSVSQPARAETDVSMEFFVETLSPHGEWVEHPRHGRVWYPRDVGHDWRPYTRGRWANTEEHGWTWVSDEEWGWGPYHYGRWDFDDRYGWVWIPGYDWGPAWVEWRTGGGHIGWAPMPPAAVWGDGGIVYAERFDYYAPRYRPAWVFVPEVHFLRPRLYTYCAPPARNVTIINKTTQVTNYTFINKTVINKSINVNYVQNVTKTTVPTEKVVQANVPVRGAGSKTGGAIPLFKPIEKSDGKPKLAAGVNTAAIVQSAKARAPAKKDGEAPKPNAAALNVAPNAKSAVTGNAAKGAEPKGAEKRGAEKQRIAGTQQSNTPPTNKPDTANKPAPPVALKSEGRPKVEVPKKVATPPPPRDDSRLKAIQERQREERAETARRQQQERSKAALLQKPGVIRDQVRERLEQRRIQTQQRQVVQNRPVPPRVSAPPPRPVPTRQQAAQARPAPPPAQAKPAPKGQQPPPGQQPPR
jgi:hypothetical protein